MNNRKPLKFLAALLGTIMVILPFAGLDALPREVRAQIDSERSSLGTAQSKVKTARNEVVRDLQNEPDLFHGIPASQRWTGDLNLAATDLQSAARDMDQLTALEKQNRRGDRQRVESLLSHERLLRTTAATRAEDIQKGAAHWIDLKHRLPAELAQMESDYRAIHGFDFAPVAAVVQKAETDWPEKKADLDARLAALHGSVAQSDTLWQSTAEARKGAAAGHYAGLDFAGLFAAAETLHNTAGDLPKKPEELKTLTGQLYNSWDKLLVDMEVRGSGNNRSWDQKIRTVTTHLPNATAQGGETTSDEKWVEVSRATFDAQKSDLGMAIEHKPAGKYDTEAERVAQPAGFAYMAPPGQRNQYGYWDHRDGRDFWVFYGQYALMRDLLFNHSYRPLDRSEWEGYRTYQNRGETYYGRDSGSQRYGTQGSTTQDRYSGSTFAKGGGFRDSQYASKSGGYRDSRYASPNASNPNADHSPRRFGGNSSSEPHVSPPPSRSYRPSTPSYRPPVRSPGRRFGRR
jgi:hypothetical protein